VAVTLIHDATIVTGDDAGTIHYDGDLAVEGGRIVAIGPSLELLARYSEAERVDGRDRAVFPGLANTHTHLSRVIARGIYEDLSPPHTSSARTRSARWSCSARSRRSAAGRR
jgi:5-methylthioadenosine/S-adenosylhomocysteine deaminase